jgi:beta-glucosidase-like glycosyl hydrolase
MTDYEACSSMFNAGIDMFMLPGFLGSKAIPQYISNVKISIQNNTLDISRIDDAVTKIIAVKLSMGVAELVKS